MPTALPMLAKLGATEQEPNYLDARDIVRRIQASLSAAVIDWQRGDRWVQETLQQLIDKQTPEIILAGHRTLHISLSHPEWPGEQVSAVVSGIDRGLGDALFLKLDGPFNLNLLRRAAQDFSRALAFPFFLECNYQYRFQTITRPGGVAPDDFVRWWQGDRSVSLAVRELTDWPSAVRSLILDWLSSYEDETQRAAVIPEFSSPDVFADAALRELHAIGACNRVGRSMSPKPPGRHSSRSRKATGRPSRGTTGRSGREHPRRIVTPPSAHRPVLRTGAKRHSLRDCDAACQRSTMAP